MKNTNYLSLSGQHLLIFVTLHEVETVTATAEKLDITQSAVSHSLQKMRTIFSDELFVRSGRNIAPTDFSKELYPEIKSILQTLNKLSNSQSFEPSTASINYRIASADYPSNLIFPKLYSSVSSKVKSLALNVSPPKRANIELLRSNEVDLVLSPNLPNHSDIMVSRLFSDIPHCFYDDTIRKPPRTFNELKSGKFVSLTFTKGISLTGNYNQLVEMLDNNTIIRVPSFSSIPEFIKGTDLLAILPSKLSQIIGYQHLTHSILPYQANTLNIFMLWHKRYQDDEKHKWFREQLSNIGENLTID